MEIGFRIHNGTEIEHVSPEKIADLARFYELDRVAPGRYSALFVINIYMLDRLNGVSHERVVGEVMHLEGLVPSRQTKAAGEFTGGVLNGLWHKHFLPVIPSVFAHNILNHLGRNGLKEIVDSALNPARGDVVTKEMIQEIAHRTVEESLVNRGEAGKLTGEWIIFAKDNGKNYYLSIARHDSGDENIASNLKVCAQEFPFVERYLSEVKLPAE